MKSRLFIASCLFALAPAVMFAQPSKKLKPRVHQQVWECNNHGDDSSPAVPLFTVNVVFENLIRGYEVSAVWNPSQVYHGVVGPAIVRFQEKGRGRTHIFTTNYFSLPTEILSKSYVTDSFTISPSIDGARLRLKYPIRLPGESRGSIVGSQRAPFFFRDVDFDGEEEVVFVFASGGQRSEDTYQACSMKCHCPHEMVDYHHPIDGPAGTFDALATFDQKAMTMTKHYSGGGCSDVIETYKWYPVEGVIAESPERELVRDVVQEYKMGSDGNCYLVTYKYTRSTLKEVSRVKAE